MCLPKTPEVEWFIFVRKIIVFMGLYSETVRETSCFLHLLSNSCFLHHSLLVLSSLFQCLRFRICVLQTVLDAVWLSREHLLRTCRILNILAI